MKTEVEILVKTAQSLPKNQQYWLPVLNMWHNENHHCPRPCSPEEYIALKIIEEGQYTPDLYKLPVNWGHEQRTINAFKSVNGFKMVLGDIEFSRPESQTEHKVIWEAVVSFPNIFNKLFKVKYLQNGVFEILNPEIFTEIGIEKPYKHAYICSVLNIKGDIQLPDHLGWWSTDRGGYGSFIENPFTREISKDWVFKNIQRLGYLSQDLKTNISECYSDYHFKHIFLENYVLPKIKGCIIHYGAGHYEGRPLGMRRGIEEKSSIQINTIKDLEAFGFLGCVTL